MNNNDEDNIRIVLVDDHGLMREALTAMLSQVPGISVVGCAASGEELISHLTTFAPQVILMDIVMHGMSGLEATKWVKDRDPDVKVILLSGEIKKEFLTIGIQTGIDGYLTKDVEKNTLVNAIKSVHGGNKYFNEAITALVFEDFYNKNKNGTYKAKAETLDNLTKREVEVLSLIATGKSNKEVAGELFISVKTVETHKGHILEKLGLENVAQLVKYAIKNKIIADF